MTATTIEEIEDWIDELHVNFDSLDLGGYYIRFIKTLEFNVISDETLLYVAETDLIEKIYCERQDILTEYPDISQYDFLHKYTKKLTEDYIAFVFATVIGRMKNVERDHSMDLYLT